MALNLHVMETGSGMEDALTFEGGELGAVGAIQMALGCKYMDLERIFERMGISWVCVYINDYYCSLQHCMCEEYHHSIGDEQYYYIFFLK